MSTKAPSPRADALRAQREARFGHLQATADPEADKAERLAELRRAAEQRKRPYVGKTSKGEARGPRTTAIEKIRNERKRFKYAKRTALPKDSER